MRNHDNNNYVIANLLKASAAISISIFLVACGDDSNKTSGGSVEDQEVIAITDKTVSGVSQKGPFVNGSSVTVQELDGATLAQTGLGFEGKIKNDLGEFSIKVKSLQSQYALLKASGFYRNEVSGEKSKSQVTLYALTDLSARDEVNVNLLTHLEYERSMYLASEGLSVGEAKRQAENEVLASFGIEGDFANSEDLEIFGTGDGNAALLAVSVLMQGDLSEADFSERLANYAADIEEGGAWDDEKSAVKIADWAAEKSLNGGLSEIRNNIVGWELSGDVPAFEKYVDNYWWKKYGLDACTSKREGEMKAADNAKSVNNGVYFICKNNSWVVASDLEYDTYEKKCDEDGKIIFGNVNKERPYDCDGKKWREATDVEGVLGGCVEKRFDEVAEALKSHYICESRQWRKATDIEKDTYKWKPGKDADVKNGDVVKTNCYVFEDSAWRSGNANDCLLELLGCIMNRQDTVGLGNDKNWYICDSRKWRNATNIEKDTATWGIGKFDGEIRTGQINKTVYYIYETDKKAWRNATTLEKDTYDYKNNKDWDNGADGEIKKGSITDSIYVFDATAWRTAGDVEKVLGGCVSAMQDSVGKVSSTYYICNLRKWNVATILQYDTYKRECTQDGKKFYGNVNTTAKYVCDDGVFRTLNSVEILADSACTSYNRNKYYILPKYDGESNYSYYKCTDDGWNFTTEILNQGSMIDERDGHEYKTIGIGSQVWMAENLSYADSANYPSMLGRNWCMNDADSCTKYGRYYTWSAIIDSVYWSQHGMLCGFLENSEDWQCILPPKVPGICPKGWHVPSESEWKTLFSIMGNNYKAMQAKGYDNWKKATDIFGFSAMPAGKYYKNDFADVGSWTYFWSSFWGTEEGAFFWFLDATGAGLAFRADYDDYKYIGFSVRCIRDE